MSLSHTQRGCCSYAVCKEWPSSPILRVRRDVYSLAVEKKVPVKWQVQNVWEPNFSLMFLWWPFKICGTYFKTQNLKYFCLVFYIYLRNNIGLIILFFTYYSYKKEYYHCNRYVTTLLPQKKWHAMYLDLQQLYEIKTSPFTSVEQ